MPNNARRLDRAAFFALVVLLYLAIRGWDPIRRVYLAQHNVLAETNLHLPTADLFLWSCCALIFYYGTKMWAVFAPQVFQLSGERAAIWRHRLRLIRLAATLLFLALTLFTLYRYGYNFREAFSY